VCRSVVTCAKRAGSAATGVRTRRWYTAMSVTSMAGSRHNPCWQIKRQTPVGEATPRTRATRKPVHNTIAGKVAGRPTARGASGSGVKAAAQVGSNQARSWASTAKSAGVAEVVGMGVAESMAASTQPPHRRFPRAKQC
jgi:hypothetical protein